MKTNYTLIIFVLTSFLFISTFSSCTKDSGSTNNTVQQGDSVIEMLAIYTTAISSNVLIKYNNVIDVAIKGTLAFHLKDGQVHYIPFSIPAGNKNLESWYSYGYLNVWDYTTYYDSTSGGTPPTGIDGSWEVDFVKITSVTCSDKKYGFKLIEPSDDWTYYHPTDPITSVSFISNSDTISFSNYAFNASSSGYYNTSSAYSFYFYGINLEMFSVPSTYPLYTGQKMDMPFLRYYWNSRNHGSQVNVADTASNGSTLKLTITGVNDKYYDANFSGKIWSSLNPDTLFISDGVIKNALLPIKFE